MFQHLTSLQTHAIITQSGLLRSYFTVLLVPVATHPTRCYFLSPRQLTLISPAHDWITPPRDIFDLERRGKKITATSHNTMKCGNFLWGIGWATWILTRILLSLCVRMRRVLRSDDNRCPFMHGRPDSHTLASYPLAAQGNSAPASSQTSDQKFDWNWNEEIQEHVIWLRGWSAVSTQSHRRSAIRNIRYACIAGGYSMGLESGIISRWLDCENRPRWV